MIFSSSVLFKVSMSKTKRSEKEKLPDVERLRSLLTMLIRAFYVPNSILILAGVTCSSEFHKQLVLVQKIETTKMVK